MAKSAKKPAKKKVMKQGVRATKKQAILKKK